jgi:hypothetical protein
LQADAHNPGYPSAVDIIILMVWRKENGQWKMLASRQQKFRSKLKSPLSRNQYAFTTRLIFPSILVMINKSFL